MAIRLRRALGATAREAVIRPLTDQPEVIEELVATASAHPLLWRGLAKAPTCAVYLRTVARLNPNTCLLIALRAFISPRKTSLASSWLTSPLPSLSIISHTWPRCWSDHL